MNIHSKFMNNYSFCRRAHGPGAPSFRLQIVTEKVTKSYTKWAGIMHLPKVTKGDTAVTFCNRN